MSHFAELDSPEPQVIGEASKDKRLLLARLEALYKRAEKLEARIKQVEAINHVPSTVQG